MDTTIILTRDDAQEVWHKLGILEDTPDLIEHYELTREQSKQLVDSIPKKGGTWNIPSWGMNAVKAEMADHIIILRDIAADANSGGERGQSLRIAKQAKRFERMFGLSD